MDDMGRLLLVILSNFGIVSAYFVPIHNHYGLHQLDPKLLLPENMTCSSSEFRCDSGRCLPARWQCDGEPDCEDKSDENPELCASRTCDPEEWSCKSGSGQCIPLAWLCDEHDDCDDASDEEVCNQTCTPDEFTCDNGRCIQKRWLCDKEDDCGDASDERQCPEHECDAEQEFACGDGYCVTKRWRCDGDVDCPDASDEKNCDEFHQQHHPPSTANATAEESSLVRRRPSCSASEFQCLDHFYCIHHSWLCDGDTDCPDGSDEGEEVCGTKVECRSDQFRCKNNGECIPGHLQCSGKAECSDGSDEQDCRNPDLGCDPLTSHDCTGDGKLCVALSKLCDGHNDCGAWQDESKLLCNVDECAVNNGGCEHKCVDRPIGYRCECKQGYKLVGNNTCQDIDECLVPGTCSQHCINREGGFKCTCMKGYLRDPQDRTRCKASEGHPSLLFAHKSDIRKVALDRKGDTTSIVNETRSSCAVDFVFRTGMVFWSDVMTQKIYKAPIDEGYKKEVVIDQNIVTADGLACDWVYSHLFWTDTGTNSIMMSDFDGRLLATVVQDQLEEPRAIAVYPRKGWLFWSDWGEQPRIERAGMDGSHRSVIVSKENVRWPNGITLDLVMERIYWVDAKLNLVGSADLDGANSRVILYSPEFLKHPFSVSLFEDWIYWTDWDKNTIFRADKFNGKEVQPVTATHMKQIPMVVHVYHPYRQPESPNHCLPLNGRCSHICLPAPQLTKRSAKTACFCPDGMKLANDSLNCLVDPDYVSPEDRAKTRSSLVRKPKSRNDSPTEKPAPRRRFFEGVRYHFPVFGAQDDSAMTQKTPSTASDSSSSHSSLSKRRPYSNSGGQGLMAGIVIGAIAGILVLSALLCAVAYRRYWSKSARAMNFDNPVYRKTTEEPMPLAPGTASSGAGSSSRGSTNGSGPDSRGSSTVSSSLLSTPAPSTISGVGQSRNLTSTTLVQHDEEPEAQPLNSPSSSSDDSIV